MASQRWEVVGGGSSGGILAREGKDVRSPELPARLGTGALVDELQLEGERLRYKKLTGRGPDTGWVSLKFKGADLVVRTDKRPWDPYELLGVKPDATDAEIRSAFRKASVKVHPDRCPDDADAGSKFRELTHAKEFLLTPHKRLFYNLKHRLIKPVVNVEWWSDWDTIFDEIDADLDLEGLITSEPGVPPPLSADAGRVDILIMGATGLTGTVACSVCHRQLQGRTWAIAGRDGRKLERLRSKFQSSPGFRGATRVESTEDLEGLARSARAVCDLTGPKIEIGTKMAEACVRAGAHYVEVTAEVIFNKLLRDTVDSSARAAGVCVLGAGGLNCVAQDLGTWYLVKYLRDKYGLPTRRVDVYMHARGGAIGGSMLATGLALDVKAAEAKIKEGGGPFYLGGVRPGGEREEDADQEEAVQDATTGLWATNGNRDPNQYHVRASCGMMDASQPYGDNFLFKNWSLHGDKAAADNARFGTEWLKRMYKQSVQQKKIPPVGTGPGERLRQEAFCTRIFVAEADGEGPEGGPAPKAHLIMNAGPGGCGDTYEGSATTVLEAASTILDAADSGPDGASGLRPGYGTPVSHLAHLGLFERLVGRGFTAKVVDGPPSRDFFKNIFDSTMPIGDVPPD